SCFPNKNKTPPPPENSPYVNHTKHLKMTNPFKISLLVAFATTLFLAACEKQDDENHDCNEQETAAQPGNRSCGTMEAYRMLVKEDPSIVQRMEQIENFTQLVTQNQRLLPDGTIEIPVVVNVLYKTNAQNISLAQIQSQIDVLN